MLNGLSELAPGFPQAGISPQTNNINFKVVIVSLSLLFVLFLCLFLCLCLCLLLAPRFHPHRHPHHRRQCTLI